MPRTQRLQFVKDNTGRIRRWLHNKGEARRAIIGTGKRGLSTALGEPFERPRLEKIVKRIVS